MSLNTSIFIIYFFLTCEIDGGGVAINDGLDKRQILHECETFFSLGEKPKEFFSLFDDICRGQNKHFRGQKRVRIFMLP